MKRSFHLHLEKPRSISFTNYYLLGDGDNYYVHLSFQSRGNQAALFYDRGYFNL